MRYVILRDDDTRALTPVECLERLYRPFLDQGLPVNLAVIPDVATDTTTPDGKLEGFLTVKNGGNVYSDQAEEMHELASLSPRLSGERAGVRGLLKEIPSFKTASSPQPSPPLGEEREKKLRSQATIPIGDNRELVKYLRGNPGYRVVQHGCHHDYFEFDRESREEISARLDHGTKLLVEAGFPRPQTFVAPYDKISRTGYQELAKRFRVISTGWFELGRLPFTWWPNYVVKKTRAVPHWRVGRTTLLSHPGCLLSCHRSYDSMLEGIIQTINSQKLTVLVTHWWEYFRNNQTDEKFIGFLHQTADYLASNHDIKVISFSDLAQSRMPLN
jgi:predicted deacetylase